MVSSNGAPILTRMIWIIVIILTSHLFAFKSLTSATSSSSTTTTTTVTATTVSVIRIRTMHGIRRVALPNNDPNSTLSSILASAGVELGNDEDGKDANLKCRVNRSENEEELDLSLHSADKHKTAAELGLAHGSMITILSTRHDEQRRDDNNTTTINNEDVRYDPYPDLAKSTSYSTASRRARAFSRGVSRGRTYGDISKVRSAMHVVEPQSEGPLKRVYVCQVGATKFQNHCLVKESKTASSTTKKKQSTIGKKRHDDRDDDDDNNIRVENRVALLFGTINKEAMDNGRSMKAARTSLSSPRSDMMCEVAKVHAVWEPPFQKPKSNGQHYDEERLLSSYCTTTSSSVRSVLNHSQNSEQSLPPPPTLTKETDTDRAIRIASWLGLHPIGWIFSYADEDRHEDGDALPVHGRDAIIGSKLQIETMKRRGREEGCKFVTLALDGRVGATEAFQLSDVCVQMVAEGVLLLPSSSSFSHSTMSVNKDDSNWRVRNKKLSARILSLQDPVIVSGEETNQLDSVLLLVNMAMLSHVGMYSGGTIAPMGGNVKRTSGELLVKTRKRILSALKEDGSSSSNSSSNNNKGNGGVLHELCDLDILMAIDLMIGKRDSEKLCKLVRNYARGQKKGTVLDDHLKLTLQTVLGG